MFYENELNFLRDVFRKCRVNTFVGESGELVDNNDIGLKSIFGKNRADEFLTRLFSERLDSNTVYRLTDGLGLSYSYLLLPPSQKGEVLFIGPYLKALPSKAYMLELGEKNGISPKRQRYLEEYYESIPVLSEGNYLFTMLSVFCERIWDTPSFSMVEVDNNKYQTPVLPVSESLEGDDFDDVIMNMKALERRYEFENEMIQAVSLGQLLSDAHVEELLKTVAPVEKKRVYAGVGDYFSQEEYDQVRKSDDNVFSKYAAKARQGRTEPSDAKVAEVEFYTETLAQIYAEQGYYEQAKLIYSKLILAYPEKSAYFATLIQKLEEIN